MPRSMVFDVDVDVPAAEMYGKFTTIGYWQDLVGYYREQVGPRAELAHFSTGESGTDVSFSHILSADDLPPVARKVVSGTFVVTREQHFEPFHPLNNEATGRYRAHIPAPVELTGDYSLFDTGGGSRMRLKNVCRSRVPIIGGQIEQLLIGGLEMLLAQEGRFTADWLVRRRCDPWLFLPAIEMHGGPAARE